MRKQLLITFLIIMCNHTYANEDYKVYVNRNETIIDIALEKLSKKLKFSTTLLENYEADETSIFKIILLNKNTDSLWIHDKAIDIVNIESEGYQIINIKKETYVIGGDDRGLMYGILYLRDYLRLHGDISDIPPTVENPHFSFRAIKFNLPWSSYRIGESIQMHHETVRDTIFWKQFLDMMVDNRFNTLSLWNLHPYTFMIHPEGFPEANQFTGQEFADWQTFWHTLFRMAKNRGIETYIINWNIITSPGMTKTHNVANYKDDLEWHYGFSPADTSKIIVDYMRQCITQTINEYPNLTGVGVSIGERMKMPIEDAMEWVKNTFVEGIMKADRPAKFIHRAPFSIDPEAARQYIESYTELPYPIIMEFKFNWSHGHSSPNLSITHGGKIADQYWNPKPKNYKMAWMMRNEDFLMLNWGNTDFIREHIAVNGHKDIVAGYFVGSETYIPAKEFRMNQEVEYEWKYAFEKQWEFYQMWGNLLYNPKLPDSFFIDQFNLKYGEKVGSKFFKALQLGSEMPLSLASFYQGTWDFTLYCEGFLNGKQLYRNYEEAGEAFIRVEEMISHPVLDERYLNIDEYNNRKLANKGITKEEITPLELAHKMKLNGEQILDICNEIETLSLDPSVNQIIEFNDLRAWAYLSLYFSEKVKGGILIDEAVKTNNKKLQQKSIEHLKAAASYWEKLIQATAQYQEVSLLHIRTYKFSWKYFYPKVLKDIEYAEGAL